MLLEHEIHVDVYNYVLSFNIIRDRESADKSNILLCVCATKFKNEYSAE